MKFSKKSLICIFLSLFLSLISAFTYPAKYAQTDKIKEFSKTLQTIEPDLKEILDYSNNLSEKINLLKDLNSNSYKENLKIFKEDISKITISISDSYDKLQDLSNDTINKTESTLNEMYSKLQKNQNYLLENIDSNLYEIKSIQQQTNLIKKIYGEILLVADYSKELIDCLDQKSKNNKNSDILIENSKIIKEALSSNKIEKNSNFLLNTINSSDISLKNKLLEIQKQNISNIKQLNKISKDFKDLDLNKSDNKKENEKIKEIVQNKIKTPQIEKNKLPTVKKEKIQTPIVKTKDKSSPSIKIDFSKDLDEIIQKVQKPGQKILGLRFNLKYRQYEKSTADERMIKSMNAKAFAQNNRVMIPIRYVAESFDLKVSWDKDTNTVILKNNNKNIQIPLDKNQIIVNSKTISTDVKPIAKNNRTYLSIANIANAMGLNRSENIFWNQPSEELIILRNL